MKIKYCFFEIKIFLFTLSILLNFSILSYSETIDKKIIQIEDSISGINKKFIGLEDNIKRLDVTVTKNTILSKEALEKKIDIMKSEQKVVENLSNFLNSVVLLISILAIIVGIIGFIGYMNLKKIFEEKLNSQDLKIDGLRPIFVDQAIAMADRDLTLFMNKMIEKEIAILNISRSLFTELLDKKDEGKHNRDTLESKISDENNFIYEFIETEQKSIIISSYLTKLYSHPDFLSSERDLMKSIQYFKQNPYYYILPCLKNIKPLWQGKKKILKSIDELINICEEKKGFECLD